MTDLEARNWENLIAYKEKMAKFLILPDLRTEKQKRLWAKLVNRKEKLLRMGLQSG